MNESMKFEDLLKQLNEVVSKLEKGDLSLDESIEEYKKGLTLANTCKKMLEEAKAQVEKKMEE